MSKLAAVIILPFLISACHRNIHLYLEPGRNACINPDSTEVVFYMFSQVYRPAKGFSAFPDGGLPEVLYRNITLYRLNINTRKLDRIFDFGPLNPNRDRWSTLAFYRGDSVAFKLTPVTGWETELRYPLRGIDSTIRNKYSNWFIYSIQTEEIRQVENAEISKIQCPELSCRELVSLTGKIPVLEWGINLDDIYPQSQRKRINGLVELEGNQLYRDAVVELLSGDLTGKDIDRIIMDLNRFTDRKKGYSRARLLEFRDATIRKLESIRKKN